MRHLHAYWDRVRGERAAPARAEIDPSAIRQVLADTFLLGRDAGGRPIFRLAGTRVCALICRDLKGERFDGLFEKGSRGAMNDLFRTVAGQSVIVVADLSGRLAGGPPVSLEMLMLPLRHVGAADNRVLGALTPAAPASWLGLAPVIALALEAAQFHLPAVRTEAPQPAAAAEPAGRLCHGFTVFDGGRTERPPWQAPRM
jgi:hypothetical protein